MRKDLRGRGFQADRITRTKALPWEHTWQLTSKKASVAGVRKVKGEKVAAGHGV